MIATGVNADTNAPINVFTTFTASLREVACLGYLLHSTEVCWIGGRDIILKTIFSNHSDIFCNMKCDYSLSLA